MSIAVGELAVRFGCELRGDPEVRVQRVATLALAGSGDLSFLANPHYRRQLGTTRAGAVVLDAASAAQCPGVALISANPYATYARIAALLHPAPAARAGVHERATLDPTARHSVDCDRAPGAPRPAHPIGTHSRLHLRTLVSSHARDVRVAWWT